MTKKIKTWANPHGAAVEVSAILSILSAKKGLQVIQPKRHPGAIVCCTNIKMERSKLIADRLTYFGKSVQSNHPTLVVKSW